MELHSIELFSGVGMLGEGLRAGFGHLGIQTRTLVHVEREAYAAAVLAARMEEGSLDEAPVWSDVCTFDALAWRGLVDCIVAGFPCQDLSVAGRRAGLDGKRSGLFFEVVRIARDSGAWLLVLENVAGIASATASVVDPEEGELDERAAARVVGELADLGWDSEWITLSASDVGASHGRARWFCLAWRRMDDAQRVELAGQPVHARSRASRSGAPHAGGAAMADAKRRCDRGQEPSASHRASQSLRPANRPGGHSRAPFFAPGPADERWAGIIAERPWLAPALSIEEEHNAQAAFAASESLLRGEPDGLAHGLDFDHRQPRLKCIGNGVVALQAAAALVVLARRAGLFNRIELRAAA